MKPITEQQEIELKLASIPPNAKIYADQKLIEQVIINLINNSIHALSDAFHGQIQLSCSVSANNTILMVKDNGKGIEENIMDQIFIPFYTTKKNGSGIGLSLSKNIMKNHEGNLVVQSDPGKNTTFSLIFKN